MCTISSALCQNYDFPFLQLKLLGRILSIMIRVGRGGIGGGDQPIVHVIIERLAYTLHCKIIDSVDDKNNL